jgi:hypothetical protein
MMIQHPKRNEEREVGVQKKVEESGRGRRGEDEGKVEGIYSSYLGCLDYCFVAFLFTCFCFSFSVNAN